VVKLGSDGPTTPAKKAANSGNGSAKKSSGKKRKLAETEEADEVKEEPSGGSD
jgi:hypothetical protein